MSQQITAHGETYQTVEAAQERIAALRALNAKYGASDGRVTEILLIKEAIAALEPEQPHSRPRKDDWTAITSRNAVPMETRKGTVWRATTGPVVAYKEGQIGFLTAAGKRSEAKHVDGTVLRGTTAYGAYKALIAYHEGKIDSHGNPVKEA